MSRFLLLLITLTFACKTTEKFKINVKVLKIRSYEVPTSQLSIYQGLLVYHFFRTPLYIINKDKNTVDTLGKIGEGPGEFKAVYDFKIKNNRLILCDMNKLFIFNFKNKKITKEIEFFKKFKFKPFKIVDIINDTILLLSALDLTAVKTGMKKTFMFLKYNIKSNKILKKIYVLFKHPDKKVIKILGEDRAYVLPKSVVFFNDTFCSYNYLQDKIEIYDLHNDKKIEISLNHKGFKPPFPEKTKHLGMETYMLPSDPSKGLFKKDSFLVLFLQNYFKNWNILRKAIKEQRGLKEEEKRKFNFMIEYILLKNLKHIGTFIFPDSLWKKEIVYYPVKIEMENDTFKGYFYSTERKELKVIFFKLEERKL